MLALFHFALHESGALLLGSSETAGKLGDRFEPISNTWRTAQAERIAVLTDRYRQIMELLVAGDANKEIAARLGINQRTGESRRALIMKKTGAKSLPDPCDPTLSHLKCQQGRMACGFSRRQLDDFGRDFLLAHRALRRPQ